MEKYDDGASAGMLGTVYDDMERQIQPGKTVGTTFDRNKVGGFGIYQAEDLVGLYAVENPTEILLLFDYEGHIWPKKFAGDPKEMKEAYTWFEESQEELLRSVRSAGL